MRDTVDRLNVQKANFTLKWKDFQRYHTANGVLSSYPGDIYGRVQWALDPLGFVHFKGLVDVTDGMYTGRLVDLPPEARPDRTVYTGTVAAANAAGDNPVGAFLIIRSAGVVDLYANYTAGVKYIAFDGVRYALRADT